jgi:hypothetical protein
MKTIRTNDLGPQLASCVAPEDLNCGDYVAVLNVIHEFPSFLWCCESASIEPDQPVQVKFKDSKSGLPLKIKAICLPFVFVKSPKGVTRTMDVRRTQFVRLNSDYAKVVWKEMLARRKPHRRVD